MLDMVSDIWTAFHSVSESVQKEWLQSVLFALREQDDQSENGKQAVLFLVLQTRTRRHAYRHGLIEHTGWATDRQEEHCERARPAIMQGVCRINNHDSSTAIFI